MFFIVRGVHKCGGLSGSYFHLVVICGSFIPAFSFVFLPLIFGWSYVLFHFLPNRQCLKKYQRFKVGNKRGHLRFYMLCIFIPKCQSKQSAQKCFIYRKTGEVHSVIYI